MRELRRSESRSRDRCPSSRGLIDDRSARIAEPEQLRHLVVRLARRIVARAADEVIFALARHEIEAGVTAGDDEHDRRQRQRAVVQEERFDVPREMMHGHERQAERQRDRLGRGDADEQRPDEAGPLRDRDRAEVLPRRARFVERALEHAADVANVLPRRQLRHDAAPFAMDRDLRGDHARADRPRASPDRPSPR